MNRNTITANNIRKYRKMKGMTLQELGDKGSRRLMPDTEMPICHRWSKSFSYGSVRNESL